MGGILLAFQFLTRIPLPHRTAVDTSHLGAASAWFPLVGLFIGELLAAGNYLLSGVFSPPVVAALLLALATAVTGGLHLDGLMDTADGLLGSRDPARSLAIMRDSRVGAMGVLAAVLILLLKWTLLVSWIEQPFNGSHSAFLLMPTLGRWSMVYALYGYPYARKEGGLGRPFSQGVKLRHLLLATLITLLVSWFWGKTSGLIVMLGVGAAAVLVAHSIARRIGGLTGDVYGAINEVSETIALLLLLGLRGDPGYQV